jgi:predicted enzyme related to lactoylglutathione lyase
MAVNPVSWFEIYVQDMDRAREFYEAVLDVTLARLDTGGLDYWAFPQSMDRMGASGALIRVPGVPSGGNSVLVYFECDDCAVEGARIAGAGGKVHREKMAIGQYGFVLLGVDTEGNAFGLHSMR